MKTILLTGCAGFIGANFLKTIATANKKYNFIILDALTYAGHYPTIEKDISENSHFKFIKGDIRNREVVENIFKDTKISGVIHFAAESHVDNSIINPNIFVETNVLGTLNLLNAAKRLGESDIRFLHVSTDEVYGQLKEADPAFCETTPIAPSSPYSASKAGSDLIVRSYHETYKMDVVITRCSNNYGPYQFPEKLIPLMIHNALNDIKLPVYGDGRNIRDWIYVDDHCEGIWQAFLNGKKGEVYNFGGNAEMRNIDVVKTILKQVGKSESLISFVEDRKGHDWRYAINFAKAKKELNWQPKVNFTDGIKKTINWYVENQSWINSVKHFPGK